MDNLERRILSAAVAACSCKTKSGKLSVHNPTCRYRVLMECESLVLAADALLKQLEEISKNPSHIGVFSVAALHGAAYSGPTWEHQAKILKQAMGDIDDDNKE